MEEDQRDDLVAQIVVMKERPFGYEVALKAARVQCSLRDICRGHAHVAL